MARDSIVWISGEDPDMARAIQAAQSTFPEFARQAELENFRIVPGFQVIAVKAFFPDPADPTRGEHMFVTAVYTDGKVITGILNSDPQFVPGLEEGQEVTFPLSRLSDWFLVTGGGKGLGGFTIDVLKRQRTPAQVQEYEDQPPYSWYRHRGAMDAMTELSSVPVCARCGVRDIIADPYRDGVCGLCLEGGVRCACPRCGAPLIRYPGAPPECHRCLIARGGGSR